MKKAEKNVFKLTRSIFKCEAKCFLHVCTHWLVQKRSQEEGRKKPIPYALLITILFGLIENGTKKNKSELTRNSEGYRSIS